MIVRTLVVGPAQTNCYLVADEHTRQAAVIDPSWNADLILAEARSANLAIELILITHGHFDHIGAAAEVHEATGAPIIAHAREVELITSRWRRGAFRLQNPISARARSAGAARRSDHTWCAII